MVVDPDQVAAVGRHAQEAVGMGGPDRQHADLLPSGQVEDVQALRLEGVELAAARVHGDADDRPTHGGDGRERAAGAIVPVDGAADVEHADEDCVAGAIVGEMCWPVSALLLVDDVARRGVIGGEGTAAIDDVESVGSAARAGGEEGQGDDRETHAGHGCRRHTSRVPSGKRGLAHRSVAMSHAPSHGRGHNPYQPDRSATGVGDLTLQPMLAT